MNVAAVGFGAAMVVGVLSTVAALVVPQRVRSAVVGVGTALAGIAGVTAGAAAMAGQSFSLALPGVLPLSGVSFTMDGLGGLFMAVTGGVAVAAGMYGISYTRHGLDSRLFQAVFPVFVAAMLLVPVASSVGTLLVCWELMASTVAARRWRGRAAGTR